MHVLARQAILVGALLSYAEGFAIPSAARGNSLRMRGSRVSVTCKVDVEQGDTAHPPSASKPSLTRRLAVAHGISAIAGAHAAKILPAQGHCLTQACLEALPDPLADSSSIGETPPQPQTKLPDAAYAELKNGQKVCRVQLGLLQLSPKTSKGETTEYWEPRRAEVVGAMKQAVDRGFTTFELADVYGEAEEYVGAFHDAYGFPAGGGRGGGGGWREMEKGGERGKGGE